MFFIIIPKLFLDKKFDKTQGCDAFAKNEFRFAKMPKLAPQLHSIKLYSKRSNNGHFLTLHSTHFFNAHASRPLPQCAYDPLQKCVHTIAPKEGIFSQQTNSHELLFLKNGITPHT